MIKPTFIAWVFCALVLNNKQFENFALFSSDTSAGKQNLALLRKKSACNFQELIYIYIRRLKQKIDMKKFLLVTIFALCTVISSCGTDDNNDNEEEQNSEAISATIDGASFEAENISAVLSNDGERLVIIGTSSNNILTITLGTQFENEFPVQEQTYVLDGTSVGTINYVNGTEEYLNRVDISGAFITISEIDSSNKRITGSFSASVSTINDPEAILISNGIIDNVEFIE